MAEWRIEELDGDNPIVWIDEHTYFVAEHDPSMIVNAHNADCAAYRAELARVKAESLRVVVDGEAYSMDDVDIWRCVDNMLGLYMYEKELLLCDDGTGLAAPVRLERWEDE